MRNSPVFSKPTLLHKLFNPLLGMLIRGSRNPQSPEVKGMCPAVYQREYEGVCQKGDLIWGSREKESNTWKGFLEEAAFKLGLEETKKCGFFKKRERWIVCQLCWQIKACQTDGWGQSGSHTFTTCCHLPAAPLTWRTAS